MTVGKHIRNVINKVYLLVDFTHGRGAAQMSKTTKEISRILISFLNLEHMFKSIEGHET